jgi:basic membrane lipoprotein Med (substrate-binding protein (PBP1-ABC) superfamily)
VQEDYKNALRAGQKAYRACVARGQSPYLAVLDDILVNVNIVAQEPLGLVDIPTESIVGTKTSGRHTAFAPNFMPLLGPDTEFASKWSNLCDAHLSEGIHTPITAYEFLNRFYVVEGNKRVSVLKHYGAVTVPGMVTRLIPARNDSPESRIYYEFLDFYKLSRVNNVHFSRPGSYAKLQTAVCKASDEVWSDDDRLKFSSFRTMFGQQFRALGGEKLPITVGDAMLVYLSVYRYAGACDSTPAQIKTNLAKLWDEIEVLAQPKAVALSLEPAEAAEAPLLSKLFNAPPSELHVVCVHESDAQNSPWVEAHERARDALEQEFPDRLVITRREHIEPEVDAEQVIEEVVHDGADVIFASSERMMTACLKVAAQHPKVKILNCSLNTPHPMVRTYYPRTYEATYFQGILAGIVSPTDTLGYAASYPIYGVSAAINAFVQGARSVRPNARVVLRWGCKQEEGKPLDFSDRPDITVFNALDDREAPNIYHAYALCRRAPGGEVNMLAMPIWRWDIIYKEIIRSILNGTWNVAPSGRAVNYWWGMKSGAVQMAYADDLGAGTAQLLHQLSRDLVNGDLHIFPLKEYSQDHTLHAPKHAIYTPEELMQMDWLDEAVEGQLPAYDDLDVKARVMVDAHGLDVIKPLPFLSN